MALLFDTLNEIGDIQRLIDTAVRESEVLEYKTASTPFDDNGRKEIAKDVSSMANSLGGLIVYGIATDTTDRTKPIRIEPVDVKNIETFDRVVNSQIQPPVEPIRKKLLPAHQPQVMLVGILASENPPHQSLYDKRYYRRSGTESRPMEYDLVAMHFGRRLGPVLSLLCQLLNRAGTLSADPAFYEEVRLRITVVNDGKRIGRFVNVILRFPPANVVRLITREGNLPNIDRLYQGIQVRQFTENVGVFHPMSNTSIIELGILVAKDFADGQASAPFIEWTIMADEMPPRTGIVSLRDLGWT